MSETIPALNLEELEARACEALPQMAYDYYAGGADDEVTLRENRAAYERIAVLPRMLANVSVRAMGTTVLGQPRVIDSPCRATSQQKSLAGRVARTSQKYFRLRTDPLHRLAV